MYQVTKLNKKYNEVITCMMTGDNKRMVGNCIICGMHTCDGVLMIVSKDLTCFHFHRGKETLMKGNKGIIDCWLMYARGVLCSSILPR